MDKEDQLIGGVSGLALALMDFRSKGFIPSGRGQAHVRIELTPRSLRHESHVDRPSLGGPLMQENCRLFAIV
jgi:hypothetical protein